MVRITTIIAHDNNNIRIRTDQKLYGFTTILKVIT